jgi:ABC-type uncharacterized transport system ATPase subunit
MDGHDKPALEFDGLVKRFGDHVAVDHIDLKVPATSACCAGCLGTSLSSAQTSSSRSLS